MGTWFRPTLSADERTAVLADRDPHPDPVVRRKMLVLWATHLGHTRQQAADLSFLHQGITLFKPGKLGVAI